MEPEAQAPATIVVGIDGTERGDDALALARLVASPDSRIVLAAIPHWRPEEAERWLARAAESHPGVALEMRLHEASTPARGLHELAQTTDAELVVVGSSHRGWLGRILPGSVGERLLHDAPCAVGIAPRGFALNPETRLEALAVAYDTSAESESAVRFAANLAATAGAALRILTTVQTAHVAGHPGPMSAGAYLDLARGKHHRLQAALGHLDELLGSLPRDLRVETWFLDGDPAARLLEETGGDIDLLVVGSRGYGAAARVLMGSVLSTVIRAASCAVITVRPQGAIAEDRVTHATELTSSSS